MKKTDLDYYKILGIDEKSSQEDIKKAYRSESKLCHPDLHPNDVEKENRFKEVNEANEVLSSVEKRAKYDKRHEPNPFGEMFDIFNAHQRQSQRNVDIKNYINLELNCEISLEDYFNSTPIKINYHRNIIKPGSSVNCTFCGGQGFIKMHLDHMAVNIPCDKCKGKGVYQTLVSEKTEHTLHIKYGNIEYVIPSQGHMEKGMVFGAVYVKLKFRPSNGFSLDQNSGNITHKVNLSLKDYLVGCYITIPYFNTSYKIIHVNDGESVKNYRLKGRGIKLSQVFTSDLIVTVSPKLPVNLTNIELSLVEELSNEPNFNVPLQTL